MTDDNISDLPIDRRRKGRGRKMQIKPLVQKAMDEGNPTELMDNLTVRQRAFANEYIRDYNATEAARRAGYTGNNLNKQGYQQLTHPGVRAAIDLLIAERTGRLSTDVDKHYIINKWIRMIEKCDSTEQFTVVLKATEMLAKHLGMFVDRTEISGKDGEAIKIEKVKEDADAFSRTIAGIATRKGTTGASEPTEH